MLKFFKRQNAPTTSNPLQGSWKLLRTEGNINLGEDVTLDFTSDGQLIYTVREGRTEQIIKLVYQIADNILITDQPTDPHEERNAFQVDRNGQLILEHEGGRSIFIRRTTA